MNKTRILIKGMHCRSCELLIEDQLSAIGGVKKVEVSEKEGCAVIYHKSNKLDMMAVENEIKKAGYEMGTAEKKPWISKNLIDYTEVFVALIVLFFLYILVDTLGLTKLFGSGSFKQTSLLAVLLVGLAAGFSTCMALVGGLVLGLSARFAEKNSEKGEWERFKPHLFFNTGRIVSYAVLGGVIGLAGSVFQPSGTGLGLMTLAAALIMLTLGMQLTGLFPRLTAAKLTLPKGLSRLLGINNFNGGEYSNRNAFILGGLTFFLPCGFTQAMQLAAIGSGSFGTGAAIMGLFALGTVPGLLGIGGLTAVMKKGEAARRFFRFTGAAVTVLAIFNMNNGLNLLGWKILPSFISTSKVLGSASDLSVKREGDTQIAVMKQTAYGYEPNKFTIVKGIKVRWVIDSLDPNSCASSIIASKIGVRKNLKAGENIVEFTPTEEGIINFSCSMGMYKGQFNVVREGNDKVKGVSDNIPAQVANVGGQGCSAGGGCGGCGGGKAQAVVGVQGTPVPAKDENGVQLIKTTYTQNSDISPNQFTVKAGRQVRMEIDVKDQGSGCMSTIYVPQLTNNPQFLEKGKTLVLEFTSEKPGTYPITCAMGVPRGQINVI